MLNYFSLDFNLKNEHSNIIEKNRNKNPDKNTGTFLQYIVHIVIPNM